MYKHEAAPTTRSIELIWGGCSMFTAWGWLFSGIPSNVTYQLTKYARASAFGIREPNSLGIKIICL